MKIKDMGNGASDGPRRAPGQKRPDAAKNAAWETVLTAVELELNARKAVLGKKVLTVEEFARREHRLPAAGRTLDPL